MLVGGVEISASAASFLALLLDRANHGDLAQRVGLAVDANACAVSFRGDERDAVLAVLDPAPAELCALRTALAAARPAPRRIPAAGGEARDASRASTSPEGV